MPDVRVLAAAYGVRVELAALGDWGTTNLIAEYDPDGPVIRVDERLVRRQAQDDDDTFERAVAHELYHHREAIGEIPRFANRAAREAAADAFADALVSGR